MGGSELGCGIFQVGSLTALPLSLLSSPAFCPPAKALVGIFQILSLPLKETLLSFFIYKRKSGYFYMCDQSGAACNALVWPCTSPKLHPP